MINTAILSTILAVNIIWAVIWFYRKTQTLSYKVHRFIATQKVKPRVGKDKMHLSEDAMIQIFLRCGNENWRDNLRQEYNRDLFVNLVGNHLNKVDNMFVINEEAKFVTAKAPMAPPIEKDDSLIEL